MTNEVSIIITLSVIIFASPLISKLTKIPVIPIEIILGSVAMSLTFINENYIFTLVAELGFLSGMFEIKTGYTERLMVLIMLCTQLQQKLFPRQNIIHLNV